MAVGPGRLPVSRWHLVAALAGLLLGVAATFWLWQRAADDWDDRRVSLEATVAANDRQRDAIAAERDRAVARARELEAQPVPVPGPRPALPSLPADTAEASAWRSAALQARAEMDTLRAQADTLRAAVEATRRTAAAWKRSFELEQQASAGLRAERDSALQLVRDAPVRRECRVPVIGIRCPVVVAGVVATTDGVPRLGVAVGIPLF